MPSWTLHLFRKETNTWPSFKCYQCSSLVPDTFSVLFGAVDGEGGILLAENPPPRYSRQPLKSASNGVSLLDSRWERGGDFDQFQISGINCVQFSPLRVYPFHNFIRVLQAIVHWHVIADGLGKWWTEYENKFKLTIAQVSSVICHVEKVRPSPD